MSTKLQTFVTQPEVLKKVKQHIRMGQEKMKTNTDGNKINTKCVS